jgi:hypothetical protein
MEMHGERNRERETNHVRESEGEKEINLNRL